jgi:regulator of cell morphogenesis and NO signaling
MKITPATPVTEIAESSPREAGDPEAWRRASLGEIMDHAASRYHARLHQDLPHIERLAESAVSSDAPRHPELVEITRICSMLRNALEEHTAKEERLLFPLIRQLAQGAGATRSPLATLAPAIEAMTREQLHKLTDGFQVPADGGSAMRSLYHELTGLERGLHKHMLIEDQILFPRALEIEGALLAARAERGRKPKGHKASR